ncbi:DNA-directed RNA polymerases I and III subunit RPAC2-like isoform X1 [Glycine soja]|uniref:DNA-directed RNA polymerases I and III subunit RPAC2 isoform X1 n=1 Tax=Glycine max TaxID=3847 RepID=UPI0007190EBB|nr:DNA-directed RNA polymerases I and III subunit RPAC2 isoform X1 [Glycine max]XP_028217423.1 DNA-directed RNA polymerases I and III subunit RPAC2-like isoform X1 [Glycine soja]|eukprot:XP_014626892.1 DNA-directed RNA polymerases I and III subunit RPAC2 isoform X1 [Glycine max]
MELGSYSDQSKSTFSLVDEDHTFANSVRFTLNQELVVWIFLCYSLDLFIIFPRVTFCGYSIPHPSDNRVNIRVQTTGDPAREVLKDGCQDLMLMCQHVRSTFDNAMTDFKRTQTNTEQEMDTK